MCFALFSAKLKHGSIVQCRLRAAMNSIPRSCATLQQTISLLSTWVLPRHTAFAAFISSAVQVTLGGKLNHRSGLAKNCYRSDPRNFLGWGLPAAPFCSLAHDLVSKW